MSKQTEPDYLLRRANILRKMHSQINAASRKLVKVRETDRMARDELGISGNLTRERVLQEIDRLDHEIGDLTKRIETGRNSLTPQLQEDLDELESSIVLARQFTNANSMDFRRVEFGLTQLRALKAEVQSSLNGSKFDAQD